MSVSKVDFSNFINYRQLIIDLTTDLKKLKEFCNLLKLHSNNDLIDEVLKRIANDSFDIAIVGEFKRGKSTLINALLGKDVLPTDILPCSATLNRITYNITPMVKIDYKDGRVEEIEVDALPDYVTKLTEESEKISETIKEATVYYPINFCRNNVDIIDTPGLNDDKSMTEVTLSVLPQVDAAILVIMAQAPFSEFERDFLENKLLTNDLGRVMFVVTGIDRCEDDEVERVLKSISTRIEQYVIKKAEKTFGKDSDEFAVYRRKIGKPKVFGISAKQALKAKLTGNNDLLEKSCFNAFEKELERFLTEDRGAVFLQVPINRILSTSAEILKSIDLQENALSMKKEEFEGKYQVAVDEMSALRTRKKEELSKINNAAKTTFKNIQPLLSRFWIDLENETSILIEQADITINDLDKDNIETTQQKLIDQVTEKLKICSQNFTEKIQVEIAKELDAEVLRLQDFESDVALTMSKVHNMFTPLGQSTDLVKEGLVATASSFLISGFSGVVSGYRVAGAKGALVGGLSGFGSAFGGAMILSLIGIPLIWPAVLALGVVSFFTGNWVTKKVFAKDSIEKFKTGLKDSVLSGLSEMKSSDNFASKVREQIDSAFNALKSKVEVETDTIINDTQYTLDNLKRSIDKDLVMTEQEKIILSEVSSNVKKFIKTSYEINNQLVALLEK
ncbi:MAG: dynamin family protein [Firmicutes bacterium HGW-Firmicutes-7]|nr:MAG: dynamin family protein [Firmicutes bacterium HGW-Firmicutes-7]